MPESIVVVGSCMIDFTSYVPRLPKPGETLAGTEFERSFGGKGANQCVAAAKLGASTTLVACLGSDIFGKEYLKVLEGYDVDTKYIKFKEEVSSGIAQITVDERGENTIVIVPGANSLLTSDDVDNAHDVIQGASVLLAQFETPFETTLHALKIHKGHGISIVNGAPAAANVDRQILENCDIFCVNVTEAEMMTSIQPLRLHTGQKILDKFFELGCNTVIITLGSLGAIFATRTQPEMIYIPVESVVPVDTTGAGDAFLGALGYFIAYHPDLGLEKQISRACQVAARSVLKIGTQSSFPRKEELANEIFS